MSRNILFNYLLTIFALLILLPAVSYAEDNTENVSYLCVAEKATGFSFNETTKDWDSTDFFVDDRKYVISKAKAEDYIWSVTKIGINIPTALCKYDFTSAGFIKCSGYSSQFWFSRDRLKYLYTESMGYWSLPNDYTPYMEIGKCSPL